MQIVHTINSISTTSGIGDLDKSFPLIQISAARVSLIDKRDPKQINLLRMNTIFRQFHNDIIDLDGRRIEDQTILTRIAGIQKTFSILAQSGGGFLQPHSLLLSG